MRLFIAVPVDPIRKRVGQVVDALASKSFDIKWVRPENLHFTLRFLGELPQSKVEAIGKAMDEACRCPGFGLRFGGISAFPNLAMPRVVWIGLKEGEPAMSRLAESLDNSLKRYGVPIAEESLGFKAHLTIGRVRSFKGSAKFADKASLWTPEKLALPDVPVDRLVLYESRFGPAGPTYEVLKESPLA
ncbi:MAG: RNA 2',3'-cyclic phosphodiesterase [Elusimicrobia bacterium]|nr:RNA 2',3'-cyclic phosphodiesterase [Elusimicrobiota bacterium]